MKQTLKKHGFTLDPDGLWRRKHIVMLSVALRDGVAVVLHEGQFRAPEHLARFEDAADLDEWLRLTDKGWGR